MVVALSITDVVAIMYPSGFRPLAYTINEIEKRKRYKPKRYNRPNDASLHDSTRGLSFRAKALYNLATSNIERNENSFGELTKSTGIGELSPTERVFFDRAVQKFRGCLLERRALEADPSIKSVDLTFRTKVYKIGNASLEFTGRIDGVMKDNEKILVEIKARAPHNEPQDYEQAQVQLYMHFLDFEKAALVYRHNKKNTTIMVEKDPFFWEFNVEPALRQFVDANLSLFK